MTASPKPPDPSIPRPLATVSRWLEKVELTTGGLMLLMVFSLMLTQAVQRHLPVSGWVWTGELARYGLVWLTFSLAGYLVGRDEHITLKVVDLFLRGRALRTVWVLANLSMAAVSVGLVLDAAELVFGGSPQSTPALGIPMSWTYIIPMVGLALAGLRSLLNTLLPTPPALEPRLNEEAR